VTIFSSRRWFCLASTVLGGCGTVVVVEGGGGAGGTGGVGGATSTDGGGGTFSGDGGGGAGPLSTACGGTTCPDGSVPFTVKATPLCGGSCGVSGIGYLLICASVGEATSVHGACGAACEDATLGHVQTCECDGGTFYVCGK
jgi:hypothetical protein